MLFLGTSPDSGAHTVLQRTSQIPFPSLQSKIQNNSRTLRGEKSVNSDSGQDRKNKTGNSQNTLAP